MQEHSNQNLCLYSRNGERKYLKPAERHRALGVMARMERERALFGLLIAWTGGRVSLIYASGLAHWLRGVADVVGNS